jgi:hypothetical protein
MKPVTGSTEATTVGKLLHVPPAGELVSEVVAPRQMVGPPSIVEGKLFTVNGEIEVLQLMLFYVTY